MTDKRFKWKEYFENIPILAFKSSLDGKILDCNNQVLRKLGYKSKKELVGKPLINIIYAPSSREKAEKLFSMWKKTGKIRNEELQVITKHGELLFVLLNADTIYNKEGKPLHSLSTQIDITTQKQAEKKLQKDEKKLRSIFDSSPSAITVTDAKANIVECNKATLDLHGYSSKDEVIGKSAFKLIAKKDQEKAKKNMEIALKEGQIKKVYFTFLKKDGSEFNAELSASPIYDTSGNMTGFVAITQDITVQEKTKLETKRFVKAIETAREATSITSGDGVIIYTNRAMDELFGYKEGELVGKYPSILNAGPRPELVTAQIMNQIKEEGYWEGEIYNKKKNGTEFLSYARISSLKDKDGNIINFLSTQHDITERKQMEEDLRKSKEKYQMLYDSSKDGIIYTDIDGNILDANQAYIDMIGYTIEELRKLTYQKLTPSEWYKTEMEIVRNQVKRRGYSEEYEKEYIRKNGSVFPISIRVWLINDDQGTPLGMWGLVRDITERKQMEEAIKASEEKYRSLAENAMDAIYLISTRNGFEYINPAFERIFGYKAGEIYNKDFRFLDLVYPADRKLIEQRKEAREKGEKLPSVYGFRVITKEGDMKHVEVNTIVLPGKENNVLGILRDVTEKKKIEIRLEESERELRKQKSALEQKNVALREVIAQVELEKRKMKDDIEANFSIVLNPILEKFKNLKVIKPYVNLLQHYIEGLTSSYGILIKKKGVSLTSREMEICNLIKGGLSSKEISKLLNISYRTIEKHRDNIRHKLGISNKKINLTTFLREL